MTGLALAACLAGAAAAVSQPTLDLLEAQIRRCQLDRQDGCIQTVVRLGSGHSISWKPAPRADPLGGLRPAAGLLKTARGAAAPGEPLIEKAPAQLRALAAQTHKQGW